MLIVKTKEELILQIDKKVDLKDLDTSLITDMSFLFKDRNDLDLNGIASWNVSNVTNMTSMFENCHSFNVDISSWDVKNVKSMWRMFSNCERFNQDISKWNVSNVKDFSYMFFNAKSFNQDLRSWNFERALILSSMFENCESLSINPFSDELLKRTICFNTFLNDKSLDNNLDKDKVSTLEKEEIKESDIKESDETLNSKIEDTDENQKSLAKDEVSSIKEQDEQEVVQEPLEKVEKHIDTLNKDSETKSSLDNKEIKKRCCPFKKLFKKDECNNDTKDKKLKCPIKNKLLRKAYFTIFLFLTFYILYLILFVYQLF